MSQLLIDEHLVFDENTFLLFHVNALDEEPLRLGAIASRCLAMLLRSDGAVVRKRELMAGAWGQYGLEVTDNSLAQVVRQLRLAFEKLQPDREFIQTLPRIGYKLADGVIVEELPAITKTASTQSHALAGEAADAFALPISALTNADVEPDEPPSIPTRASSAEPGSASPPVQPATSPKRWGLWLALPVWGVLAFLAGRAWLAPSSEAAPPVFAAPVIIDDVRVHVSARDVHPPASSQLQRTVQNSRELAGHLGLSAKNIHLYLLPSRRGADHILCDGELDTASSRCIGVQQHD